MSESEKQCHKDEEIAAKVKVKAVEEADIESEAEAEVEVEQANSSEHVEATSNNVQTKAIAHETETETQIASAAATSARRRHTATKTESAAAVAGTADVHAEPAESMPAENVEQAKGKSETNATTAAAVVAGAATTRAPSQSMSEATGNGKADSTDFDAYAEHVTYEANGEAIYTEPSTKQRYKWCTKENSWLPLDVVENEHYKWCAKTQQWLPKATPQQSQSQSQGTVTETEHYKWDAEKQEWIAKSTTLQQQTTNTSADADRGKAHDVTYGIDAEGQRIYTDKDGSVYVWDEGKSAWFPKIDDDFMARYQMSYGFIDNTSAGEQEKREREQREVKRKEEELQRMADEARAAMAATSSDQQQQSIAAGSKRKAQEPPKWFDLDAAHNTKVYVSNLPLDITIDEFAELMGKCGMIMRDQKTQKYKLKLYAEADGQIKGDGLCDYIKVESVDLALKILDDYDLRGHKIRVQRAKFQMRGEYNPALKPKRKKKDKEKLQKMKEKLFDWRPDKMRGERTKNEKTVIVKNLFVPELFESEVQLILDYQNDLREEASKCGTVRKVVIYDRHPEGVAQINMSEPEEADLVIQMMHGRYFGKRQLSAEHWDGKTKFKIDETATEAQERISNWNKFLETTTTDETTKQQQQQQQADEDNPVLGDP